MKRDRESEISSREDDKNVESKEMNDEELKELDHKLYYAAYDGEYEVVKKLLQNVKKLLQNMVDVKAFMNKSRALLGAAYGGHIEIVNLLIQNGANVNAVDTSEMDSASHRSQEWTC
jgi:ankyrin repeat protein